MSYGIERKIEEIINPIVTELKYEIVRIQLIGSNHKILQIMIDRVDGKNITIEDCSYLSRQISSLLDVEDPIAGEYSLEVSSAGIDRPLTKLKHYQKYSGYWAKVELLTPLDGRKRFSGVIKKVSGETIVLKNDNGEEFSFQFMEVAKAKLILTDELIKFATNNE